jgi:hypothetical protein
MKNTITSDTGKTFAKAKNSLSSYCGECTIWEIA